MLHVLDKTLLGSMKLQHDLAADNFKMQYSPAESPFCWSSLGKRTYQVDLNLIPRTKTRDRPKDELNPMITKALSKFWAN